MLSRLRDRTRLSSGHPRCHYGAHTPPKIDVAVALLVVAMDELDRLPLPPKAVPSLPSHPRG